MATSFFTSDGFNQFWIYELNTRIFCKLHQTTIQNLPDHFWNSPEMALVDAVWLMGIWRKSSMSSAIASMHDGLSKEFKKALTDFKSEDVIGSPYAIYQYSPDPLISSSWEEVRQFRDRLHSMGKKLILDFVPNHMAVDSSEVDLFPNLFLIDPIDSESEDSFIHSNGTRYRHGKDPYFPGWTDTVQWDFSASGTSDRHLDILCKIAEVCDGVRCDMAMLPESDVFQRTHGRPGLIYWEKILTEVRKKHPGFVFIAEVYWGMEYRLICHGFDFTYDKTLYDRLHENSLDLKAHLKADLDYQEHSLRFLENHDENRAAKVFGESEIAKFSLLSFLPGALLLHEGQSEAKEIRIPVQLARYPKESDGNEKIKSYFNRFFNSTKNRKGKKLFRREWKAETHAGKTDDVLCYALIENIHGKEIVKEFCIYNQSYDTVSGFIKCWDWLPDFEDESAKIPFFDLCSGEEYEKEVVELRDRGFYFLLHGFQAHHLVL